MSFSPYIYRDIAGKIDYTMLRIDIDIKMFRDFLSKGKKYRFRALVVTPSFLEYAKNEVEESDVKLVSVIGFPLGQTYPEIKLMEARSAAESGADELDIVLNVSLLKSGYLNEFHREAEYILSNLKQDYPDLVIKYILEVTILSRSLLKKGLEIINNVKPDYFKTSTGYGLRGTSVNDIRFVKKYLSNEIGVKASGGIRTLKQFTELLEAGADIVGSSSGDKIVEEAVSMRSRYKKYSGVSGVNQ